jgi:hypothetical protein
VIADGVLEVSFVSLSAGERADLEALLNRILEGWAARSA